MGLGERKVTSKINTGDKANEKLLELVISGSFSDVTDLAGPRNCEVTFKFISQQKISVSFTYRDNFYDSILELQTK